MPEPSERLNTPISTAELERRWKAVRAAMERERIDVLVMQGPFGGAEELTAAGDGVRRGVKRVLTTPSYASAGYTNGYDPELAASALTPFAKGTIGLVCTYQMSLAMGDFLKRRL